MRRALVHLPEVVQDAAGRPPALYGRSGDVRVMATLRMNPIALEAVDPMSLRVVTTLEDVSCRTRRSLLVFRSHFDDEVKRSVPDSSLLFRRKV